MVQLRTGRTISFLLTQSRIPLERLPCRANVPIQCLRSFSTSRLLRAHTLKKATYRRSRLETSAKKLSDIPRDLGFLGERL